MNILITTEKIKEIAQDINAGMQCYYHIQTGELESFPDELRHAGFEEEMWSDVIKKVKAQPKKYIHFEAMDSRDTFRLMETFVTTIADGNIRRRFEDAIGFKKPFQNFKQLLHEYPGLREEWFRFSDEQTETLVRQQLEAYNNAHM